MRFRLPITSFDYTGFRPERSIDVSRSLCMCPVLCCALLCFVVLACILVNVYVCMHEKQKQKYGKENGNFS